MQPLPTVSEIVQLCSCTEPIDRFAYLHVDAHVVSVEWWTPTHRHEAKVALDSGGLQLLHHWSHPKK